MHDMYPQQYVFSLIVHEITKSNLMKLYALSDRHIKMWLSMPPSGTLAIVLAREGLSIKSS